MANTKHTAALAAVCGLFLLSTGCATRPGAVASSPLPDTESWRLGDDLEVTAIASGVWMHTTWRTFDSGVRFPSNGLIVRDGASLTLIDTAWGVEPTEALFAWIDATLALPVRRAVITHFHDDRFSGAPVLRQRDVPIEMHALTSELAGPDSVVAGRLHDLAIGEAVGAGAVEIVYPGPAHTRDNLAVWVPSARVLFGGCALRPSRSTTLGNVADADVDAWPESVALLKKRYPNAAIVVPSHGAPGGVDVLDHTLSLLAQPR